MARVFNFSSGPAVLPESVLLKAQAELLDYNGTGMSVLEMSHRSSYFGEIMNQTRANLRDLMKIPDDYEVLFLQGGASSQFSMIPLNLLKEDGKADFIDTGTWSSRAIKEANRFAKARIVASSADKNYTYIPKVDSSEFDPESTYVHITTNNTIFGTCFPQLPNTNGIPLIADVSSNILSQEYRVEDFALLYAGAQKNMGPAGITVVILRKDLIGHAQPKTPLMFDYQIHSEKKSMYNTPPTFVIYMMNLVLEWVIEQGGVPSIEELNRKKAGLLYDYLDQSEYFSANVAAPDRSIMNITFRTPDAEADTKFVAEAEKAGLSTLKGHRSVGGLRASLYNSMPIEGVEALVSFMTDFEKQNQL